MPEVSIEVASGANKLKDVSGPLVFAAVPSDRGGWCVEVGLMVPRSSPDYPTTHLLTLFLNGDCATAAFVIDLLHDECVEAA